MRPPESRYQLHSWWWLPASGIGNSIEKLIPCTVLILDQRCHVRCTLSSGQINLDLDADVVGHDPQRAVFSRTEDRSIVVVEEGMHLVEQTSRSQAADAPGYPPRSSDKVFQIIA